MSVLQEYLTNIANAIREKKETTAPIPAQNFANEILSIEGGSKVTDTPLTIAENGTTEAPEGVRYTPITVAVPKPTLNAPLIELNGNGGYINIFDKANGNFSKEYLLYLNGEQSTILTSTYIKMQDYGITETDEIGIVAVGDTFNNSPMATARWSDLELGTIGLTYSGSSWTGLGTATETDIKVAGLVNGTIIKTASGALRNNSTKMVVRFSNSIRESINSFAYSTNKVIVCGTDLSRITGVLTQGSIWFDCRKVKQIPSWDGSSHGNQAGYAFYVIAPDDFIDEWKTSTNWVSIPDHIVTEKDYILKNGEIYWDY